MGAAGAPARVARGRSDGSGAVITDRRAAVVYMDDQTRPPIRCLIGWLLPDGHVLMRWGLVPLDDAETFHRYGWAVLVDPDDEAQLARYHHLHPEFHNPPRWEAP